MKKLLKLVDNLSLTKQLMAMIATIAVMLVLMGYFISLGMINKFVDDEMYNLINRSQRAITHRYLVTNTQLENAKEFIFDVNDPNVIHFIYDDRLPQSPMTNASIEIPSVVYEEIENNVINQQSESKRYRLLNQRFSGDLYTITHVNENVSIATIVSQAYQDNFRDVILRLVLFIVLITVFVVMVFFLIWANSIIGPLKQISSYLKDITSTKKEALDFLDRQDEIGDVARSIITMEKKLDQQEKIKMEMIHNISHDLKTPITTIKTYSESIKDGIYPYETLEKSVDVILDNADRLERKAHSLLLLNQIDAFEKEGVELRQIEMDELIQKVVTGLKVVRPEIEVILNLEPVFYKGDEEMWRITFENLLDNAYRYAHSLISINLTKDFVTIYNDGPSMSPDRIEKLFKPYEKGSDGQFGLGLSIVDRMTKKMGYRISGYNHDKGVEFKIYNPYPTQSKPKRHKKERNKKKGQDH